jgi:exopolyphosphatase/guanosine-5'-triphosphate,3'-diphosphate pyrophosphatase
MEVLLKNSILRNFSKAVSMRVAILDLGTNTFHLLIADIMDDEFSIVYREKIAVRIGEGGINKRKITPEAAQRALDAIHAFAGIIQLKNVSAVKATATSAIRNATNGKELLRKIRQQSGIDIRTISGDEEAELIYNGVNSALEIGSKPVLIMDIGGGSIEFIIGNNEHIFWKRSYETGAQRLVDKFHRHDPITKEELKALLTYLDDQLPELLDKLREFNPSTLIGSSGTFDTLSDIYCERNGIGKSGMDTEVPFDIDYFHDLYRELITKNRTQRLAIPGMIEMRVDMIVVAVALLHFILQKHTFEAIRVSTYALKEGILFKLIHKHGRTTV